MPYTKATKKGEKFSLRNFVRRPLIIGIVCRDGIVLAAESQTTMPPTGKLLGTDKIHIIEFEFDRVLVAEAGSDTLSNRAIEIFEKKAKGVKIDNAETVLNLAQKSMREVIETLKQQFNPNAPPEQIHDFLWRDENRFELMIAFYAEQQPYLYVLNSAIAAIPDRKRSYFKTIGVGSDLAHYILKRYTRRELDYEFASVIAVKALIDVSHHIEGCGLPMRLASLHHGQSKDLAGRAFAALLAQPLPLCQTAVRVFSPKEIDSLTKIISRVERETGKPHDQKIKNALRVAAEKYHAKRWAQAEKMIEKSRRSKDGALRAAP
jgi:20S proteasome alpha/beta subunit